MAGGIAHRESAERMWMACLSSKQGDPKHAILRKQKLRVHMRIPITWVVAM